MQDPSNPQSVTITNIDIKFSRLVRIILKIAIASVPAMLIFFIVMMGISLTFTTLIAAIMN